MKFGPKMKSVHGPLAQNLLRASGRETARSRKRPVAHSSSDCAPRARPPCGPRRKPVHWPARAQRVPRSRPQPGPGPGKSLPAWVKTRSGDREPSISIQRLCEVSGRTKPRSTPSRNPSPHSDFLRSHSRAAAQPSDSVG
jgi:hypothetical protein